MRYVLNNGAALYTRDEWNPREPREMAENSSVREAFIHHTTDHDAENINRFSEQAAAMRAIQNYHMDVKRFSDIAYHWVVFQEYGALQHARVFQARHMKWTPAGQEGHNTGTTPICVFGNFDHEDLLYSDTKDTIVALLERIKGYTPTLAVLGGHRDVVGTECPGDTLYAAVPDIARRAGLRQF